MRKINSNSFWVLTTFFVPGMVLAKHCLWTSQQHYMPSPSHSWGDQPPLASVGPLDSECPSLDVSTSLSDFQWHLFPSILWCLLCSGSSCHALSANYGLDTLCIFFLNIHNKLEEWALSISIQWVLLRLRQVGPKSWCPVLWIRICRSPEMIAI